MDVFTLPILWISCAQHVKGPKSMACLGSNSKADRLGRSWSAHRSTTIHLSWRVSVRSYIKMPMYIQCVYIFTYIYISTHNYIHIIYTCRYLQIHTYIHTFAYIQICTYTNMHTYIHAYIFFTYTYILSTCIPIYVMYQDSNPGSNVSRVNL